MRKKEFMLQMQVAERLFLYLDKNLDGKLDMTEFAKLCKGAGICNVKKAQKMWIESDINQDGSLDIKEFFGFVKKKGNWNVCLKIHESLKTLAEQQSREKVRIVSNALFNHLDGNRKVKGSRKDNVLTPAEFLYLYDREPLFSKLLFFMCALLATMTPRIYQM